MPDRTNSTPVPLATAREQIASVAAELMAQEARLARIATAEDSVLGQHMRVGLTCVRTDLLADAIETLSALATMTDDDANRRDAALIATVKRLANFR